MNPMTIDNRQTPRVLTSVPCFFGMSEDRKSSGTITSLSAKGCFVKTKAVATTGQTIFISLCLSEEQQLPVKGVVIYHVDDIGFGTLFTEIKPADQIAVDEFLKHSLSSE